MNRVYRTSDTLMTRRMGFTFDKMEFTFERISRKRLLNWLVAEFSSLLKLGKAWAYPTHLQIEPTNRCNLHCPLCNVVTDTNRPRGELSLEDFKRIIDEIGDYLLFIQLWGWGEPFLNENLFSMIRYAKSKGIKVLTSTNGHFFENERNIDELLSSGLDYLIFAIDGLDKESYEKYRRGGDFEKVIRGLRALVKRKKERNVVYPRINHRMVVSRDNESQIPQMKALAEEIGVDFFSLITMSPINSDRCEWAIRIPENPRYIRAEFNAAGDMLKKKNRCKRLWNHPFVYHDGIIYSCEYYTSRDTSLGNVFEKEEGGFGDIWFGESYNQLRIDFAKRTPSIKCIDCPRNYADADQNVSDIFEINA